MKIKSEMIMCPVFRQQRQQKFSKRKFIEDRIDDKFKKKIHHT